MSKRIIIFLIFLLFIVLFIFIKRHNPFFSVNSSPTIVQSTKQQHTGTLILRNNDNLLIENAEYTQIGSIELHDHAQLRIQNTTFHIPNSYNGEFSLVADGNSNVFIENCHLDLGKRMNFRFTDHAQATYNSVTYEDRLYGPWQSFSGNTTLTLNKSAFGGTIWGETIWNINNGQNLYLELGIQGIDQNGATANESNLPLNTNIPTWTFPNEDEQNIHYKINLTNSNMYKWGFFIAPNSHLTLNNTSSVNLCFPIQRPYLNQSITLSDLHATIYQDRTIQFANTSLHLLNTSVSGWCFNNSEQNTLNVSSSDIDDINNVRGYSHQIYTNIKTHLVIAREHSIVEIRDSEISGDVIAQDSSTIILANTRVKGNLHQEENGHIITK